MIKFLIKRPRICYSLFLYYDLEVLKFTLIRDMLNDGVTVTTYSDLLLHDRSYFLTKKGVVTVEKIS